MNKATTNEWTPSWRAPVSAPTGYAREAVEDSAYNAFSTAQSNGEFSFTIFNNLELDGETIGESVTEYQSNLAYTNGGRRTGGY